ncbi:hypothetical protein [Microbacterium dextranolyticum]|uniref:Uncharacterized protein n=1 Tax=Microbacterium dextranolyticum TaxID=36806 RepID=A0A9W6HK85_9MICO|nr:hypothetical protein [Microbacterium dextranolyticum]MBM7461536.1 hypothetical protein [Microbacterium dextranolyticum]GLJ94820.1 hypothetical protein GCM10017591_08820 [Microbacterium dextranolyticum]
MSLEDLFGAGAGDDPPRREPQPTREARPAREPEPPREPKPPRTPKPPREAGSDGGDGSRTPLILAIVAGVLAVAVVVTLGFALTRGGPTDADPAPPASTDTAAPGTPTSSPTPSPTPTRTPVALDFSATGFALADATGTPVFTYAWTDDAKKAVTALSAAFGAQPTQRVEPGDGSHYPDYTVYQWEGFMLFDMIETPGGTPRAQYPQPSYTLFSRNQVGGIEMVAEHGLTIGMTVDAVRALRPDVEIPRGNVGAIRFVFDTARTNAAGAPQYSAIADTNGSVITAILSFRYSPL